MKKYAKIAASALFTASLLTFGAADAVLDTTPVAHAIGGACALEGWLGHIWDDEDDYNITSLEFDTVAYRQGFNARPYIEQIMDGAIFEPARSWQVPPGEYVILEFPNDNLRFEFFKGNDGNYVRETFDGESEVYHIMGIDKQAWKVISKWGKEMSRKAEW